jgi:hypothetical protein
VIIFEAECLCEMSQRQFGIPKRNTRREGWFFFASLNAAINGRSSTERSTFVKQEKNLTQRSCCGDEPWRAAAGAPPLPHSRRQIHHRNGFRGKGGNCKCQKRMLLGGAALQRDQNRKTEKPEGQRLGGARLQPCRTMSHAQCHSEHSR